MLWRARRRDAARVTNEGGAVGTPAPAGLIGAIGTALLGLPLAVLPTVNHNWSARPSLRGFWVWALFCAACGLALSFGAARAICAGKAAAPAEGRGRRPALALARDVVVAGLVVGFVACVPGVNVAYLVERGKQRVTGYQIRQAALAIEAYGADHGRVPDARDIGELARVLAPKYIAQVPVTDPWGFPYEYTCVGETNFVLRSPGADGIFDYADPTAYSRPETAEHQASHGFDVDIAFDTSGFSAVPEGEMRF